MEHKEEIQVIFHKSLGLIISNKRNNNNRYKIKWNNKIQLKIKIKLKSREIWKFVIIVVVEFEKMIVADNWQRRLSHKGCAFGSISHSIAAVHFIVK